jgi:outer membrane protein W
MNNKINITLAAFFAASMATTVVATEVGGTYVTAGMMKLSTTEFDSVKGTSGVTVDDEDTAINFMVGYQVDENLSVEAGIIGKAEMSVSFSGDESGTLNGKAYSVSGVVTATGKSDTSKMLGFKYATPVNENFDIYGKAGMLFWDIEGVVSAAGTLTYDGTTYSGSTSATYYTNSSSDPYYGIGASYKVNKTTSINADYIKMEIDDGDVDGLNLAVAFDF